VIGRRIRRVREARAKRDRRVGSGMALRARVFSRRVEIWPVLAPAVPREGAVRVGRSKVKADERREVALLVSKGGGERLVILELAREGYLTKITKIMIIVKRY
jgi:hypothetical protein